MQTEPDVEIINRAKLGDLVAFNLLMERHKNAVFHFSLRLLKIREEAEEVAQDVFVIVFKKIKDFKGESKFTTWLYRITFNECISRIRKIKQKEKYMVIVEGEYHLSVIEKGYYMLDNNYQSKIIERSLDELDEESRTIILMFYYHEKSVAEIADITQHSVTNVKTKLHRARKSMLCFMENKLKLSKSEMLER